MVSGIFWAGGAVATQRLANLVVNILLARSLAPEDFAVVVIATALTGFAGLLGELGMAAAIIQREQIEEKHLSSGFWINMGLATIATASCALLSQFSELLSDDPRLEAVLLVTSFQFLITGPTGVHRALLWRDLRVKTLAKIQTAGVLIAGVVAVVAVYQGAGVWSIVALGLVNRVIVAILYWRTSGWRPTLSFDRPAGRELFAFGYYLTLTRVLTYITRNVDNILIGKYVGAAPLGFYSRAYTLVLTPIVTTTQVIGQVLFPALSRVQTEQAYVRNLCVRAAGAIALIIYPSMLGLVVVAPDLIPVLLGERWMPMVPVLQVLSPTAMWACLLTVFKSLYDSQGNTKLRFRVGLVADSVTLVGIVSGLPFGILGVAIGFLIGSLVGFFLHLWFSGRLVGLKYGPVFRRIGPVLFYALLMAGVVAAVQRALPRETPTGGRLLIEISVGVVVYAGCILAFRPVAFSDLRVALASRRNNKNAGAT